MKRTLFAILLCFLASCHGKSIIVGYTNDGKTVFTDTATRVLTASRDHVRYMVKDTAKSYSGHYMLTRLPFKMNNAPKEYGTMREIYQAFLK